MTIVCIISKPCSGKSTLSKKLSQLGWNVINVGERLRRSNNLDIQKDLKNGNYIDPYTIMTIIGHDFRSKTVILDGYQRDLKQLEYLKEAVSRNIFIELLCSDIVCLQRAAKRCRSDDSMILQRLKKHALEFEFFRNINTIKVDVVNVKTDTEVYEIC